jgi:hypothetical protein
MHDRRSSVGGRNRGFFGLGFTSIRVQPLLQRLARSLKLRAGCIPPPALSIENRTFQTGEALEANGWQPAE